MDVSSDMEHTDLSASYAIFSKKKRKSVRVFGGKSTRDVRLLLQCCPHARQL